MFSHEILIKKQLSDESQRRLCNAEVGEFITVSHPGPNPAAVPWLSAMCNDIMCSPGGLVIGPWWDVNADLDYRYNKSWLLLGCRLGSLSCNAIGEQEQLCKRNDVMT